MGQFWEYSMSVSRYTEKITLRRNANFEKKIDVHIVPIENKTVIFTCVSSKKISGMNLCFVLTSRRISSSSYTNNFRKISLPLNFMSKSCRFWKKFCTPKVYAQWVTTHEKICRWHGFVELFTFCFIGCLKLKMVFVDEIVCLSVNFYAAGFSIYR